MIWQHISKRDALLIVRRKTGLRGLILDLYEYVKKFHFVIKKNCAINHLFNSMSGKNFIKNYIRGVLSLQNEQRMSNIWLIWERPWGGFANAKCVLRRIWYYAIWDIMTYGILIWHIRYTVCHMRYYSISHQIWSGERLYFKLECKMHCNEKLLHGICSWYRLKQILSSIVFCVTGRNTCIIW